MTSQTVDLTRASLRPWLADIVRSTRLLIGWTQADLARRAKTSQTTIWRLESGRADHIDLAATERVLAALGIAVTVSATMRHLADRERQRDAVHAVLNGSSARRHAGAGWRVITEAQIGDDRPRGWIDLLAFRESDRSLLVQETKGDLPDFGALQRSVAFYEREARTVARRMGWAPRRVAVLVVAMDSQAVAERLRANRDLLLQAFPGDVGGTAAWLLDPAVSTPRGWTFAVADPASRSRDWLRRPVLGTVRRKPAYVDYADAARRLTRR